MEHQLLWWRNVSKCSSLFIEFKLVFLQSFQERNLRGPILHTTFIAIFAVFWIVKCYLNKISPHSITTQFTWKVLQRIRNIICSGLNQLLYKINVKKGRVNGWRKPLRCQLVRRIYLWKWLVSTCTFIESNAKDRRRRLNGWVECVRIYTKEPKSTNNAKYLRKICTFCLRCGSIKKRLLNI